MIKKLTTSSLFALSLAFSGQSPAAIISVVVLPDSQWYAEYHPEIIEAQIDWIVANQAAENIVYVAQLGDLKDDETCDNDPISVGTGGGRTEWQIVSDAYADLDAAGIPYSVVPGNHDFDTPCPSYGPTDRPLTAYDANFGPGRFALAPFYGDPSVPTPGNRVPGSNEDNFVLFESEGVKFIAINFAFRGGNPTADEVTWASNLMATYPDRLAILTSHYFLNDINLGAGLDQFGNAVYSGLRSNQNLFMMLSAHMRGESWLIATDGRGAFPPVQVLMSNYQELLFPDDGNPATGPDNPDIAGTDFGNLADATLTPAPGLDLAGDTGLMRIMRFDTDTRMVDIETFIPPVVAGGKTRTGTTNPAEPPAGWTELVSNYTALTPADMNRNTASNVLNLSWGGYVPIEIVSCGTDNTGGDLLDFRGFYHPSFPGTTLNTVELYISARTAGSYTVRLDARLNSYDATPFATATFTETLSGINQDTESFLFDFGNVAVASGSTVAFTLSLESAPIADDGDPENEVFYAVHAENYPIGGGGAGDCDMIQTISTTPPLDTLRRNGLWIRITGE